MKTKRIVSGVFAGLLGSAALATVAITPAAAADDLPVYGTEIGGEVTIYPYNLGTSAPTRYIAGNMVSYGGNDYRLTEKGAQKLEEVRTYECGPIDYGCSNWAKALAPENPGRLSSPGYQTGIWEFVRPSTRAGWNLGTWVPGGVINGGYATRDTVQYDGKTYMAARWSTSAAPTDASSWLPVGPNLVVNPSFDAEGATQTPSGWTELGTTPAAGYTESAGGSRSGANHLAHFSANAPVETTTRQTFTNLANGLYDLTAWVYSDGGQKAATLYAKDFGGAQMDTALNQEFGGWVKMYVPNVVVTNGRAEIGITSNSSAGKKLLVDDVEFHKIG